MENLYFQCIWLCCNLRKSKSNSILREKFQEKVTTSDGITSPIKQHRIVFVALGSRIIRPRLHHLHFVCTYIGPKDTFEVSVAVSGALVEDVLHTGTRQAENAGKSHTCTSDGTTSLKQQSKTLYVHTPKNNIIMKTSTNCRVIAPP